MIEAGSGVRGQGSGPPTTTIATTIRETTKRLQGFGIEDAATEAELLLAHTLDISRTQLYARLQDELSLSQSSAFETILFRRLAYEPLAYITGHKEFYGIDLLCSQAALIPRPETELLVELALHWFEGSFASLRTGSGSRVERPTIVDVGTGGGAIAIAIALHVPNARVIAIDASSDALELAVKNAQRAGVSERIEFVCGSLLEPFRGRADIIVANLPYIPDEVYASLPPEIRKHEPETALRAGPRGTELLELLLEQSKDVLASRGLLVAEHAWDQGDTLRTAAKGSFPDADIETERDLAGLERALLVQLTSVAG